MFTNKKIRFGVIFALIFWAACGVPGKKIVYLSERLDYIPPGFQNKQLEISLEEFKDLRKDTVIAEIKEREFKIETPNDIKPVITDGLKKELQRLGYIIKDRAKYVVTGDINNFSVFHVEAQNPYLLSNIQLTVRIRERLGGRVVFEDYVIAGVKDSIFFTENKKEYIRTLNLGLIKALHKILRLEKFHQVLSGKKP
ncbi:MAG: hypothetical protein ACE5GM_06225 [bacterium]